MKSEEYAWAAGFYDGEGHTALAHTKAGTPSLYLTVNQTHKEPLYRLADLFGGSIGGPYRLGEFRAPVFRWQVSRYALVKAALEAMWPFLGSVKRAQAERALAVVARSKERLAIRGPKCGHVYDKKRRCWECTQKNNRRNYLKNQKARIAQSRKWALENPEARKRINDKANARRKAIRLKLA